MSWVNWKWVSKNRRRWSFPLDITPSTSLKILANVVDARIKLRFSRVPSDMAMIFLSLLSRAANSFLPRFFSWTNNASSRWLLNILSPIASWKSIFVKSGPSLNAIMILCPSFARYLIMVKSTITSPTSSASQSILFGPDPLFSCIPRKWSRGSRPFPENRRLKMDK